VIDAQVPPFGQSRIAEGSSTGRCGSPRYPRSRSTARRRPCQRTLASGPVLRSSRAGARTDGGRPEDQGQPNSGFHAGSTRLVHGSRDSFRPRPPARSERVGVTRCDDTGGDPSAARSDPVARPPERISESPARPRVPQLPPSHRILEVSHGRPTVGADDELAQVKVRPGQVGSQIVDIDRPNLLSRQQVDQCSRQPPRPL
jgi:hypothetical protein